MFRWRSHISPASLAAQCLRSLCMKSLPLAPEGRQPFWWEDTNAVVMNRWGWWWEWWLMMVDGYNDGYNHCDNDSIIFWMIGDIGGITVDIPGCGFLTERHTSAHGSNRDAFATWKKYGAQCGDMWKYLEAAVVDTQISRIEQPTNLGYLCHYMPLP